MWRGVLAVCLLTAGVVFADPPGRGVTTDRDVAREKARLEKLKIRRSPVVEVYERCKGAVVNISTTQIVQVRSSFAIDSMFDELFDFPVSPGETRAYKTSAVGSGFVIHSSGYIVTNAHVVARTAERKVIFADKSEYVAEIVATDPRRDLAILKIDAGKPLPKIELGSSDDLMIGETTIAIGNPMGLETTVTSGVISALDRKLEVKEEVGLDGLIQTDASINPGNSGGPLFNVVGELIGITTAIRADAQNIGFAIPVNKLIESLPSLLSVERRYRIVAGLEVDPFHRATITGVAPNTPAAAAAFKPGDVLHAIDGQEVTSGIDYHIALVGRNPGETITIDIEREGKIRQIPLTLAPMPKPDGAKLAMEKFGIVVEPLTEQLAETLQLPSAKGLIIRKVDPNGPAGRTGIEPGDIVTEIGPYAPSSLDDVGLLLENVDEGSAVPLGLLRVGKRLIYRMRTQLRAR
ncbi:trypsin-like peptidase domain-containing protein [bacterium]|nr:trypsin-like peptidase domain-containing protein [bacterium]